MKMEQVTLRFPPQQIAGLKRLARQKAAALDINLTWTTLLRCYVDALLSRIPTDNKRETASA